MAKQLFKSAMGGVLPDIVTDVAFKQGHNAIDALFDSTAEQAKKAGINAVAVEQ